ncbi:EamA/RhaT family transporter [Pedobacter sp. BS3]|uniref:EamA/RhaT family transporter n=1 Tax=Pedobacter sp. BS3 TaxID=2567937 RepID=UPI0011EEECD6|nr:EamA/RhaT family transporter [Pedobacter sp. BS3]TZF84565.1 EamA/RhaT family transporter [Pedobacter sp. BS3]
MIYIALSICCSIIVSVMLKLAKRYEIDVNQAITWNYFMAIILGLIFLKPDFRSLSPEPFPLYTALGILLPVIFIVIAAAVRQAGIIRTDIAQRLSLFLPLGASFFLFNEQVSTYKVTGILLGLTAIVCTIPRRTTDHPNHRNTGWWLLLLTFAGMGCIDILFKEVALYRTVPYTTSLCVIYILAAIVSSAISIGLILTGRSRLSWITIGCGWLLGIFNFGNILFYLKAHQALAQKPSVVFTSMNIGVIILGTLVGYFVFKEKLTLVNKIGIILAVAAIIIIASQQ